MSWLSDRLGTNVNLNQVFPFFNPLEWGNLFGDATEGWSIGGITGADKASDATIEAANISAQAQREALDYLKQRERIPSAYKDEATVLLGQLYGLGGDPSFISPNVTGARYPDENERAVIQDPGMRGQFGIRPMGVEQGYSANALSLGSEPMAAANKLAYPGSSGMAPNLTPEQIELLNQQKATQNEEDIRAWNEFHRDKAEREGTPWVDIEPGMTAAEHNQKMNELINTGTTGTPNLEDQTIGNLESEVYQGTRYPERTSAEVQQQLIDQAMASPLYSYLLSGKEAGEESILRNQSAIGKLRSGSSAHALYDYNTQLQNNALMQTYNQQMAGINQMAGLSTSSQDIASLMSNIGLTQAQGISGAAQAQLMGQQNFWNSLLGLGGTVLSSII